MSSSFLKHGYLTCFLDASWSMVGTPPRNTPTVHVNWPTTGIGAAPVLYVPVKRHAGVEQFPKVMLTVRIAQLTANISGRTPVRIPAYKGMEVQIDVQNIWPAPGVASTQPAGNLDDALCMERKPLASTSTRLTGHLNDATCMELVVPASMVQEWLDPTREMKARVNENLLVFTASIPGIKSESGLLSAPSTNCICFYRKKTIVFVPGVFGSQVKIKNRGDELVGFPDFNYKGSVANLALTLAMPGPVDDLVAAGMYLGDIMNQKIGVLECDSDGIPLVEAIKPTLLRLGPKSPKQVYNVYDMCREARMNHFHYLFPEEFRIYEVHVFAYDWRKDLTQTATNMTTRLKELQSIGIETKEGRTAPLRNQPDTDDQVAIAGHSTGGLLIRRMLAETEAKSLISHAFFLNVPFRGAPKALSVMLTGRDPPGGDPMIPIVTAESLQGIIMTAPIAYHLAPSEKYPFQVADSPSLRNDSGREEEKRQLVEDAIRSGFVAARGVVPGGVSRSREEALSIVEGTDEWNSFLNEANDYAGAKKIFARLFPDFRSPYQDWEEQELKRRKLAWQKHLRVSAGWSEALAKNAREFHQASEDPVKLKDWAEQMYVFYSIAEGEKTTTSVTLQFLHEKKYRSAENFLVNIGVPENKLRLGKARSPERKAHATEVSHEEWDVSNDADGPFIQRYWKVTAVANEKTGDGTVPAWSLVGVGGKAHVFKPLQGGPNHVKAPNHPDVWRRIIEVLQGHDVSEHLDNGVDSINGTIQGSGPPPVAKALRRWGDESRNPLQIFPGMWRGFP